MASPRNRGQLTTRMLKKSQPAFFLFNEWLERDFSLENSSKMINYAEDGKHKGSLVLCNPPARLLSGNHDFEISCKKVTKSGQLLDKLRKVTLKAPNDHVRKEWVQAINGLLQGPAQPTGKSRQNPFEAANRKQSNADLDGNGNPKPKNLIDYSVAELKAEIEILISKVQNGEEIDQKRYDLLTKLLERNPEYKQELKEAKQRRRDEIVPLTDESLEIMRGFIPPHIFNTSVIGLVEKYHYTETLAKRIFAKRCLWLVRMCEEDLERLHSAELSGRYGIEAQNLDIVEAAGILACIPESFSLDPKKNEWKEKLEQYVLMLHDKKKNGTITKDQLRHAAYKNNEPKFGHLDTLHSSDTVVWQESSERPRSYKGIKGASSIKERFERSNSVV